MASRRVTAVFQDDTTTLQLVEIHANVTKKDSTYLHEFHVNERIVEETARDVLDNMSIKHSGWDYVGALTAETTGEFKGRILWAKDTRSQQTKERDEAKSLKRIMGDHA